MLKSGSLHLFLISAIVLMNCNSSRKTIADWKSGQSDYIEAFISGTIFMNGERVLLLKNGTLIIYSPKRKRSFWKTKTLQIPASTTNSLFELASSDEFLSLPENLDDECKLNLEFEKEPIYESSFFNYTKQKSTLEISHVKFDNPFHEIVINTSETQKNVIFDNCDPFSDTELEEIYSNAQSDSTITTFQELEQQNENIKSRLETFNSIWKPMFDLKDQSN